MYLYRVFLLLRYKSLLLSIGISLFLGIFFSFYFIAGVQADGPTVDLSQDEQDVIILGEDTNAWLGEVTGSANFNGDEYDDLLIGASGTSYNGLYSGAAYMILGSETLTSSIDLTITRPNLSIYGANAGDAFGHSVAGGDVNGDGYADMIVSADRYNASQGVVYVILGHDSGLFSTPMTINLAITSPALTILGEFTGTEGGRLGRSVASGDINNDGFDDIVIGSYYAFPGGRAQTGAVYAILGNNSITSTTPTTINLGSQAAAVTIYGDTAGDRLGRSVAVGDVNGDGIADIIAGAYLSEVGAIANAGKTYLFYGNTAYTATSPITFDLSITSAHVTINGIDANDQSGFFVGSGDLNSDTYNDIILSAYISDGWENSNSNAGEVYVVYGGSSLSSTISLSTSADITIIGAAAGDRLGRSVTSSDVNGDSYDDMILGASWADPGNPARANAGRSYVIYGRDNISATILVSNTAAANIHILGDAADDEAGRAVSGGDINGDGAGDIIVGALGADNGSLTDAGAAYVVYGSKAITISLTPVTDTITAGRLVTYTLIASNTFGIWDVTHLGVFTTNSAANGSWSDNTYTSENAGTWIVTGTFQRLTATASLTVEALQLGFSSAAYTVSEGAGQAVITVTLSPTPLTQVTVNYNTGNGSAISGSDYLTASNTLTFSPGTTGLTFTVSITDDLVDESDEDLILTLSNPSGAAVLVTNTAALTITDNDTAGVTVSPTSLAISEPSGSDVFTITLNSEPTAVVSISLTTSNGQCSVPASVLLDSGNWNTGVGVTVTAVDDDIADGPQTCVVQTAASSSGDGNYNGLNPDDVTVTVGDDEVRGVTLSKVGVDVAEGGITDTYTVRLDAIPTGTVTISFNTGSQLNAISSLTFAADLSALTPQTVTVSAADDTVIEGDHNQLIAHSVSGGGYDGVGVSNVSVRITDNDIAYTLSAGTAEVLEGDTGATTISFSIIRTGDITRASSVEYALGGTAVNGVDYNNVSPSPGGFNFSAGKISRTITMAVLGDYVDEGDESIIVSLLNPGGTGGGGSGAIFGSPVSTTISDDDTAGIVVSPTSLTVSEPDGSDVFTITLNSKPTATVTINLSTSNGQCSAPASVSLNSGNWNTGVGVTVTAVDDDIADGPQTCVVQTAAASSSDSNYHGLNPADVTVTVNDDDVSGVTVSPTSLAISEPSGSDVFTITLNSEPTAVVSISLTTSNGQCSVPASVLLDSGNWNTGVGVTVTAVDDDIADGPQTCVVQTAAASSGDGNYNGLNPDDVTVTVGDDEVRGVTLSKVGVDVAEGGITDTYTVRLDTIPTETVTISFNTGSQLNAISSLTFAADLSALTPQTVTVSAADDTVIEGDHNQLIAHSVSGGGYDGVGVSNVSVRITDNDIAYTLSAGTAEVLEGDTGATTISFSIIRTGDITRASSVDFALSGTAVNGADYTSVSPSPGAVDFNAGQISYTITMAVLGDYVDEGDESIIVSLLNPGGTGGGGSGAIFGSPASVIIADDDTAGIVVSPTSLTVSEPDGSDVFTITLNSKPIAAVTITLVSTDTGKCVVVPVSVTLNSENWNTGVGVTVTAVDDGVSDGTQQCTIQTEAAVSSDGNYNGLNPDDVSVTITENMDVHYIYLPLISKSGGG